MYFLLSSSDLKVSKDVVYPFVFLAGAIKQLPEGNIKSFIRFGNLN